MKCSLTGRWNIWKKNRKKNTKKQSNKGKNKTRINEIATSRLLCYLYNHDNNAHTEKSRVAVVCREGRGGGSFARMHSIISPSFCFCFVFLPVSTRALSLSSEWRYLFCSLLFCFFWWRKLNPRFYWLLPRLLKAVRIRKMGRDEQLSQKEDYTTIHHYDSSTTITTTEITTETMPTGEKGQRDWKHFDEVEIFLSFYSSI